MSAWLRKGELQAQELKPKKYEKKRFIKVLDEVKILVQMHPEHFKEKLQSLCSEAGVAVVFTPCLPKAPISGASRWIMNASVPLIQLSCRYKTNDTFWFSFYHEAGHILKHGKKDVFLENVKGTKADKQKESEARAALYSFGFLLRRTAAVILDINEWELRVGLRVVRNAQGNVVGQVFLSDALENGAGYCSQFATPAAMEHLLLSASELASSFLDPNFAADHGSRCQTSCPDCLRDYSNLAWHNILDWRMAFDLIRLALDANNPVDFATRHWQALVMVAPPPYFQALGWNTTTLGGLPAAHSGLRCEVITHPLWSSTHPTILLARNQASNIGLTLVNERTLFELVRRPF